MRQIVLDTETTGIGHEQGHRIIEIGCVEVIDRRITGNDFHVFINPEREVDAGAFRVHGISTEFLQDKPYFNEIVDDFLGFIGNSELIIHNAAFDLGFLNAELARLKKALRIETLCTVTDTLELARAKHPGQRNNLDALCKRYDIDNSSRQWHGALLDAKILAMVYLAMTGGQGSLFAQSVEESEEIRFDISTEARRVYTENLPIYHADDSELEQHQQFIDFLVKKSGINRWE